ncbi:MAG: hypothetical protein KH230_15625 [Enterocloster asparagiformis]|nr:hypothetical protein [Enterocloster asparagiformis]
MGLFSKKVCTVCGKEERLGHTFYTEGGEKVQICSQCYKEMHMDGVVRYCRWAGREPYYDTEVLPHLQRLCELMEGTGDQEAVTIGNVGICGRSMMFTGLDGVAVSMDDIYLITYFRVNAGALSETLEFVFLTKNPQFPALFEVMTLQARLRDLSGKAKEGRRLTEKLYSDLCRETLIYPVMDCGQLMKQIKADYKAGKSPELQALYRQLEEIQLSRGRYKIEKIVELMGIPTR